MVIKLHLFFTSELVADEWSGWGSGGFTWKMGHRYPWVGSWVGPRSITDLLENTYITLPARIRTHAFQPVAETLHWLCLRNRTSQKYHANYLAPCSSDILQIFWTGTRLVYFLRARAQIVDNLWRNFFASVNPSLLAPYFWLFQWHLSFPYRSALRAGVRLAHVLVRPCSEANSLT